VRPPPISTVVTRSTCCWVPARASMDITAETASLLRMLMEFEVWARALQATQRKREPLFEVQRGLSSQTL
jgi:hypothetical protein